MHKELNIFLAFSSHSTVNKETVPFNFFFACFFASDAKSAKST